ncbi:hypothetical protein SLITO_v1c05880 [Spiroplasma litorale]|uniref:Uncharacterized protein n=1 Tax=Spiroplasma litorale TaxID=216942 RepID=A0A0K1W292_9MOLU|nr:hypothetical protein [Spiroplasma litorale]AKX34222.1 hypothetical protein SLITO_v1c05880 [Spiroplasma litorale]
MKNLLSLFATLGVASSTIGITANVISCGDNAKGDDIKPAPELTYKEGKKNIDVVNILKDEELTTILSTKKPLQVGEDKKLGVNYEDTTELPKIGKINLDGQVINFSDSDDENSSLLGAKIKEIFKELDDLNPSVEEGDVNVITTHLMTIKGTKGDSNFTLFVYKGIFENKDENLSVNSIEKIYQKVVALV